MIVINTIDDNRFSVNGIAYLRKFISIVNGNSVSIKNIYDSSIELVSDNYANFTVNGSTFGSAALLQSSLVTVLFNVSSNAGSFKNKLINPSFLINQRGYTDGELSISNNQYTFDRWRLRDSGTRIYFAGNAPANGMQHVSVPGGVYLEQVIEAYLLETGVYTLSWEGTAIATVNGTPLSNGGVVNITYGSNVTIAFTNGTVYYPQFEKGSIVTPFDFRPIEIEEMLCKRYYEVVNVGLHKFYMQQNFNTYTAKTFIYTKKRATPTISFISNPAVYIVSNGSSVANALSIGVNSNTDAFYAVSWSAPINNEWLIMTSGIVSVNSEI